MENIFDTINGQALADELKVPTAPVSKAYVCNRWPELKIGNDEVTFHKGKFETVDPSLQALVESNTHFRRYIIPQQ